MIIAFWGSTHPFLNKNEVEVALSVGRLNWFDWFGAVKQFAVLNVALRMGGIGLVHDTGSCQNASASMDWDRLSQPLWCSDQKKAEHIPRLSIK
jgi:hypothetical protein